MEPLTQMSGSGLNTRKGTRADEGLKRMRHFCWNHGEPFRFPSAASRRAHTARAEAQVHVYADARQEVGRRSNKDVVHREADAGNSRTTAGTL